MAATFTMFDCVVQLDAGIGGSLTTVSTQVSKCTLNVTPHVGSHAVFGTLGELQTRGGYKWTVELVLENQLTATSQFGYFVASLLNTSASSYNNTFSIKIGAPDLATTGAHTYAGEVMIADAKGLVQGDAMKGDNQATTWSMNGHANITYAVV